MEQKRLQHSAAFIAASWVALLTGFTAFNIGLRNADMQLNEIIIKQVPFNNNDQKIKN